MSSTNARLDGLPIEVTQCIAGYLWNNKRTLLSLMLTSKKLFGDTVQILYQDIVLSEDLDTASLILATLVERADYASWVHSLNVVPAARRRRRRREPLPSQVWRLLPETHRHIEKMLPSGQRSLKVDLIASVPYSLDANIALILLSCPKIRHVTLTVECAYWGEFWQTSYILRRIKSLQSLDLRMGRHNRLFGYSLLHKRNAQNRHEQQHQKTPWITQTLKTLRVDLVYPGWMSSISWENYGNKKRKAALEELSIEAPSDGTDVPIQLSGFLQDTRAMSIRSLSLILRGYEDHSRILGAITNLIRLESCNLLFTSWRFNQSFLAGLVKLEFLKDLGINTRLLLKVEQSSFTDVLLTDALAKLPSSLQILRLYEFPHKRGNFHNRCIFEWDKV